MKHSVSSFERAPARPFMKWAGGKSQLLPELANRLPQRFNRYHEPFAGGAALFFHLHNQGLLRAGAVLSDENPELILCYETIRDDVDALIAALRVHHEYRFDRDYFHEVRAWDRRPGFLQRTPIERAARAIFLNRTSYNGLYRLNRKGQFNAPFGYYPNPVICDAENLRVVHGALQGIELRVEDFADVLDRAEPGDLVYFDPPYVPLSTTASFTQYTGRVFGIDDQQRLAQIFTTLVERGVWVMLSNSYAPLACELYAAYSSRMFIVAASRRINRDGRKRGDVAEMIVCGYQPQCSQ